MVQGFNHKPDYDYDDYDYITTPLIISHFVIYTNMKTNASRAHETTRRDTLAQWGLAFAFHEIRETDARWGGFVAFNLFVASSDPKPSISFHMPKLAATVPFRPIRRSLGKGENQAHDHIYEFYPIKYRSHSHFMVSEVSRTNSIRKRVGSDSDRLPHRKWSEFRFFVCVTYISDFATIFISIFCRTQISLNALKLRRNISFTQPGSDADGMWDIYATLQKCKL